MVEPEEIGHDLSAAKYNFIKPLDIIQYLLKRCAYSEGSMGYDKITIREEHFCFPNYSC